MTLPANFVIRTYRGGFDCVAHVFDTTPIKGKPAFTMLPATAWGESVEDAADKLTAFLEAEIEREGKRKANAQAMSERMKKRAA